MKNEHVSYQGNIFIFLSLLNLTTQILKLQ